MSSSAVKRISRSSRPALSSDKENGNPGSSENLTEMLKTLGISRSDSTTTSSSARKPSVTSSSNTSPMTTRRQTRLSREPPAERYGVDSTPKTRTTSNTTAVSSTTSASGRSRTASGAEGLSAPLTAIRRPSQQQQQRTPSIYSTPLSAKENNQRSPQSVNNAGTAIRQQRKSSVPAPAAVTASSKQRVSEDEYSALIALLAAKEEEVTRLKSRLEDSETRNEGSERKTAGLKKDKEGLQAQVTSLNKQIMSSDSAGISKKEMEKFKKQYEMQESLLQGFQRENEKATIEIDQLKRRERHLTDQLKKIYGPTFSAEIDLASPATPEGSTSMMFPSSNAVTSSSKHGMTSLVSPSSSSRRLSGFGMTPSVSSPLRVSPPASFASPSATSDEEKHTQHAPVSLLQQQASFDPQTLMQQLENVQNLVQRFERRLLSRESELIKREEEAHEQVKRLDSMIV